MSDYRKLRIWHRARALSVRIHRLVYKLPREERHRRGDQLIRTANSIRHNIVEGSGYDSPAQFAKYLTTSSASADELQDEIIELDDVGLLSADDRDLLEEPSDLAAMIVSFRKTVRRDLKKRKKRGA